MHDRPIDEGCGSADGMPDETADEGLAFAPGRRR